MNEAKKAIDVKKKEIEDKNKERASSDYYSEEGTKIIRGVDNFLLRELEENYNNIKKENDILQQKKQDLDFYQKGYMERYIKEETKSKFYDSLNF